MPSKNAPKTALKPGPLRLPPARTQQERRLVMRLERHTTSERWLPEGDAFGSEIAKARGEHLRLRALAGGHLLELTDLVRRLIREDEQHVVALKTAAVKGAPPPDDKRTPAPERDQRRSDLLDRSCAALDALADHIDATIELVRQKEPELLGNLHAEVAEINGERQELQARIEQLRRREYVVHRRAAWVKGFGSAVGTGEPSPAEDMEVPRIFDSAFVERSPFEPSPAAPSSLRPNHPPGPDHPHMREGTPA